jgi:hypothetical protein
MEDLRNHGESGHHLKHDYMEMALDVASFMESHGMERATLIGHSMWNSPCGHPVSLIIANLLVGVPKPL